MRWNTPNWIRKKQRTAKAMRKLSSDIASALITIEYNLHLFRREMAYAFTPYLKIYDYYEGLTDEC